MQYGLFIQTYASEYAVQNQTRILYEFDTEIRILWNAVNITSINDYITNINE